jgi:hypothetical protein
MSLLPPCELERVLDRYTNGAQLYGDHNWKNGMHVSILYDSCMRHLIQFVKKDQSEDHLAAAVWNIIGMMWIESNKPDLDDRDNML